MTENPLLKFVRSAEFSVKLPSNYHWYPQDMIEYNTLGEVEILPMLPADELEMVNPDGLVSGKSIENVIKSCVPSIKEPKKLLYPDVNILLLAIKKATYGDVVSQKTICPKCFEKKALLEKENFGKPDYEIKKLVVDAEERGEFKASTPTDFDLSISTLLQSVKELPKDCKYVVENGLVINLKPSTLEDKVLYTNFLIQQEKTIKFYNENGLLKNLKDIEVIDDKRLEISNQLTDMYKDAFEYKLSIMANNIENILLPDGTEVTEKDYIKEFLLKCPSSIVNKIDETVLELNTKYGLPENIKLECPCCGHIWEEKFYGYNYSDFFGINS